MELALNKVKQLEVLKIRITLSTYLMEVLYICTTDYENLYKACLFLDFFNSYFFTCIGYVGSNVKKVVKVKKEDGKCFSAL
jgi:hypothetical protein